MRTASPRWRAIAVGLLAAAALAGCAAPSASPSGPASHPATARVATASSHYPTAACMGRHPTALLLPVGAIPDMRISPGRYADGGQALNPMGLVVPGARRARMLASSAVVWEQMADVQAPRTALQNASPFNVAHPRAVTTFDEAITGFTDRSAEARWWEESVPAGPPPWGWIDGHGAPTHRSFTRNSPRIPEPNTVVVTSLARSETPTMIDLSVRSGRTVIGISFEGGVRLSVGQIAPFAARALRIISSACAGLDIMRAEDGEHGQRRAAATAVSMSERSGLGVIGPPEQAIGGIVDATSCAHGPVCTELGWNHHGQVGYLWAARWQGGSWRALPPPPDTGVAGLEQLTLSCASAGWCMATGSVQRDSRGVTAPYAAVLRGRTWTRVTVPSPRTATDFVLNHLACRSATWCMATGSYVASRPGYADAQFLQAAVWNGSSWRLIGIVSPRTYVHQLDPGFSPGGEHPTAALLQLSCASESFCVVAGSWNGAFAERWNGRRWRVVSVPDQPGYAKDDSELSGAACTSPRFCMLAGGYSIANGIWSPLVDRWNGRVWARITMPRNFHGVNHVGGIRMNAISCASSERCVSFSDTATPETDTAVIWNGARWHYEEVRGLREGTVVCLAPRSCD